MGVILLRRLIEVIVLGGEIILEEGGETYWGLMSGKHASMRSQNNIAIV